MALKTVTPVRLDLLRRQRSDGIDDRASMAILQIPFPIYLTTSNLHSSPVPHRCYREPRATSARRAARLISRTETTRTRRRRLCDCWRMRRRSTRMFSLVSSRRSSYRRRATTTRRCKRTSSSRLTSSPSSLTRCGSTATCARASASWRTSCRLSSISSWCVFTLLIRC